METDAALNTNSPEPGLGLPAEGSPESGPEEIKEVFYELTVSEDNQRAFLRIHGEGAQATIEDIKRFISAKRISYGVVEDGEIGRFLREGTIFREPCLIAQGKPMEPGRDAVVTYHFDKDPLKIGSIKTGGAIDFKNKGEIPQVKEGDLLAEKVPLIREKAGWDVFGKPIPALPAKDVHFFPGAGTKRTADGLKIFSKIPGRPELLVDGKICVFPELRIRGDVGLATGHIRFDGFVDVEGTIQEGFRVKAGRLAAKEIYRAEVEVEGDIVVDGGIVGANILTRGNLKSRFIHSSQISAFGDVMVEREVIDSKIETNGALIAVPGGKIFTSQVIAKKGISANQIGSKSSKPCLLTIGVDTLTKNAIKVLSLEISAKTEEKKKLDSSIERLTQGLRQIKEEIEKYAQVQEQASNQQQSLRKIMEDSQEGVTPARLSQAERELKKLESKIKSTEESVQKLLSQQEKITDKNYSLEILAEKLDNEIQMLQTQLQNAKEDFQKKEIPPLKVLRHIFSGTMLEGCYSSLVVRDSLTSALFRETKVIRLTPEGEEKSEWIIQAFPLLESAKTPLLSQKHRSMETA